MKNLWDCLVVAFSTYSAIPMPQVQWSQRNMRYAMCFFPLIGLIIGALLLGWAQLRNLVGIGPLLFGAVATVLPLLVTGGIHLDGFCDTCDALGSHQPREKKLEILKDSHAGAFAVISGVSYFVLYLGAAGEVTEACLPVICLAFSVSRTFSALSVENFPNANPKGTAAAFGKNSLKRKVNAALAVYLILLTGGGVLLDPLLGVLLMAAAALCFAFYHHMAMKYFGGITGDLAGFYVCVSELAMILTVVIGNKIAGMITG